MLVHEGGGVVDFVVDDYVEVLFEGGRGNVSRF